MKNIRFNEKLKDGDPEMDIEYIDVNVNKKEKEAKK
jgi:hypothetical protein